MQEIRDGRYPPEVLDNMDLIVSNVRDVIAAARNRATRASGEGGVGDENQGSTGLYLWGWIGPPF